MAGPGVVSRALPGLQDLNAVRVGQSRDRGEPSHETLEVRDRLSDAGLLQEDLGDPDPVRVAIATPGERATVGPEPSKKGRGHRRRHDRIGTGPGGGAHGTPPEEESA